MKAPKPFNKRLTEKDYAKKVLKRLHIQGDREFIEGLYENETDEKTGKAYRVFAASRVTEKADVKRVNKIAKELRKQKGRINVGSILAAAVLLAAVFLTLFVFRNQIARAVIVGSIENAVGARCDLEEVDFNIPEARFMVKGLAVANRERPMTNLVEIPDAEFHLDMLSLSRGKVHVIRAAVNRVAWNTERTVSGALPPDREKAWLERQAAAKANESANQTEEGRKDAPAAKSPVDLESGFSAVTDMLDPKKILDAEMQNLALPGVVAQVNQELPALTEKWTAKNRELKTQGDSAIAAGKVVTSIKPESLKTVQEVQAALEVVKKSSQSINDGVRAAKAAGDELKVDAARAQSLSKEAEGAYKSDAKRLSELTSTIRAANLETGTKVLSSAFQTFASAALGDLYPKAERLLGMGVKLQQRSKKQKAVSLKEKSGALSRASGRTLSFGVGAAPLIRVKDLELSVDTPGLSGGGNLQELTDDQDLNGKPSLFALNFSHGSMSEQVEGSFDLRDSAESALKGNFTAKGYRVSVGGSSAPGVPSVRGTLEAQGSFRISRSGDAEATAKVVLPDADIEVKPFDPAWIFSAYRDVLGSMKRLDARVDAAFPRSGTPDIRIDTEADAVLGAAIASSAKARIEGIKKEVAKEANAYLAAQKNAYAPQIAKFTSLTGITPGMANDILSYENAAEKKQAELEKRIKDIADAKVAEAKAEADAAAAEAKKAADKAAQEAAKKAADSVKKLF